MRFARLFVVVALAACSRQSVVSTPQPPAVGAAPLPTAIAVRATATLNDVANTKIGTATFTDTPAGLLVAGTVTGLGIGAHGAHLHAVGVCQAPAFATAGPHFNPLGLKHGFKNPAGHHAGDMPNIVSPPAGAHSFQFLVEGVKLTGRGGLLDDDGASIVIHSAEDDYLADPAGNSGGRFACGVIMLSK